MSFQLFRSQSDKFLDSPSAVNQRSLDDSLVRFMPTRYFMLSMLPFLTIGKLEFRKVHWRLRLTLKAEDAHLDLMQSFVSSNTSMLVTWRFFWAKIVHILFRDPHTWIHSHTHDVIGPLMVILCKSRMSQHNCVSYQINTSWVAGRSWNGSPLSWSGILDFLCLYVMVLKVTSYGSRALFILPIKLSWTMIEV